MRKVVDFLSILLCFGGKPPSFSDEIRVLVFRSSLPVFSSRVQVCRSGHALVHRALSEFEILAFTLHIHHEWVDL